MEVGSSSRGLGATGRSRGTWAGKGWQGSGGLVRSGYQGPRAASLAQPGSGSRVSPLGPIEPKELPALCSALPAGSLFLPCVLPSPEIHPQIFRSPEIIPQHPPDKGREDRGTAEAGLRPVLTKRWPTSSKASRPANSNTASQHAAAALRSQLSFGNPSRVCLV